MRSITIIPCYLDELGYVGFDKFLPVMCCTTYIHHASNVNYRFQANHCRLQLLGFSRIAVPCFALVRQGGKVALRPLETTRDIHTSSSAQTHPGEPRVRAGYNAENT